MEIKQAQRLAAEIVDRIDKKLSLERDA